MKEIPITVSLPKIGLDEETRILVKDYINMAKEPKRVRLELDDNTKSSINLITGTICVVSVSAIICKIALALISKGGQQ